MKLSNLKSYRSVESAGSKVQYAVVTTKRFLRESVDKEVYCPAYSSFWRWQDTGELCPNEVRNLAEAYLSGLTRPH